MSKALFFRVLTRCVVPDCRRWQSVHPADYGTDAARCLCGGELEAVDRAAHMQSLPDGTATALPVAVEELGKKP